MAKIKLIVDGGAMKPGPSVSQQLGPMGINLGQVISKVNESTSDFKGIKVPVEIDVNPKTKEFSIAVFSPPISELIKKELGIEKGSGTPNTLKVGNISSETLLGISKTKMPNLLARDLKSALKMAVGSCSSLGVMIDSKSASEVMDEINSGNYDDMIKKEVTSPSPEKKAELDAFWNSLKKKQEKAQKAAEEAKAAEEEKKQEEVAATPQQPAPSAK